MIKILGVRVTATLICVSMLSGCAFWPRITPDDELKLSEAITNPCITDDYANAQKCAVLTAQELGKMLEDTGGFDRGAAYVALGLATATGGIVAFSGGETALKALAVASGSLLGLNAVVNTKQQRPILKKGLDDMICYIKVADSIYKLDGSNRNSSILETDSLTRNLREAQEAERNYPGSKVKSREGKAFLNSAEGRSVMEIVNRSKTEANIRSADYFQKLSMNNSRMIQSVNSAKSSIGTQLSGAVVAKRAELRAALAGLTPELESILNTQRNRVVDMTGEVIRLRAEHEKKLKEKQPNIDTDTARETRISQELVETTSKVAVVFGECVDPATQKAIENK